MPELKEYDNIIWRADSIYGTAVLWDENEPEAMRTRKGVVLQQDYMVRGEVSRSYVGIAFLMGSKDLRKSFDSNWSARAWVEGVYIGFVEAKKARW